MFSLLFLFGSLVLDLPIDEQKPDVLIVYDEEFYEDCGEWEISEPGTFPGYPKYSIFRKVIWKNDEFEIMTDRDIKNLIQSYYPFIPSVKVKYVDLNRGIFPHILRLR